MHFPVFLLSKLALLYLLKENKIPSLPLKEDWRQQMNVDSWEISVHGRSQMRILSLLMLLCCTQDFPTC